jgi:hypothetical protein
MKKLFIVFTGTVYWPLLAWPQAVYNGYEAYYLAQNNLFTTTTPLHFSGSRNTVVFWQGKRIDLSRAKAFPANSP